MPGAQSKCVGCNSNVSILFQANYPMSNGGDVQFDWARADRTGIAEAVLCAGKSVAQVSGILDDANVRGASVLLTRLSAEMAEALSARGSDNLHLHQESGCGVLDNGLSAPIASPCRIVTAGSSDMPVALEAQQTLRFYGLDVPVMADCGVAGLWRLTDRLPELRSAPVIIAVAGMEGAMFPVLGGLVRGVVVAVPTSVGYGVATGGHTALNTALATCAPGVVTVNIDNGFGAACALLKMVRGLAGQGDNQGS